MSHAAEPLVVVVVPTGTAYRAHVKGRPDHWATGVTQGMALRNLQVDYPGVFLQTVPVPFTVETAEAPR